MLSELTVISDMRTDKVIRRLPLRLKPFCFTEMRICQFCPFNPTMRTCQICPINPIFRRKRDCDPGIATGCLPELAAHRGGDHRLVLAKDLHLMVLQLKVHLRR